MHDNTYRYVKAKFMSPEEKKNLIHTVIDVVFNRQELSRLEEFFTEDFYNHDGPPGAPTGPAAFRAYLPMMKTAFPDRILTPEFTLVDGDRVVSRTITEGTMAGAFFGLPATVRSAHAGVTRIRWA